ncbi:hypothetical protein NG819_15930 [Pseudarthrobacter sp. Fe7]|nr:hypothetical protein NG819_15930 [Pseudarthrobacter sp. Fe7]
MAQKKALRAAHTKAKEAQARHQIERRLFCEGLYLGAAAEFDWLVACSGPPDVPAQPGLRTTRAGPGAPGPPAKPVRRHRIQATKCSGP